MKSINDIIDNTISNSRDRSPNTLSHKSLLYAIYDVTAIDVRNDINEVISSPLYPSSRYIAKSINWRKLI